MTKQIDPSSRFEARPGNLFLLPALIASLDLILAGRVTAQTWTTLHDFTEVSDGAYLQAGLILSDSTLYGTAQGGGSSGNGTVFAVNTNGTGFTNLHGFTTTSGSLATNSDGAFPYGGLILSGNTLYGTAAAGGSSGNGTVFAVNTDGTGFTNLHNFTGYSDSGIPYAGLILSGYTLYGTTYGTTNNGARGGTVFAINTDGTGFTNLHTFIRIEGRSPYAGLISSGNTLYGTTYSSPSGTGTVFSLSFTPQLTIVPSGANDILTWPTNVAGFSYAGYALQSAPDVTGTFTNLFATTSPYTNAIAGAQKFFRLISN